MPLVSRINNVYLYVRDMERSAAFYRDVLGLPLQGDEHWQEADLDGVRFALHEVHEGLEPAPGTVKVSFEVADAPAAAEQVRNAGYDVQDELREEWGISYSVVDPDGYRVYLFQPPQ